MAWQWAAILAENEGGDRRVRGVPRAGPRAHRRGHDRLAGRHARTPRWRCSALNDRRSRAGRRARAHRRSRCSTGCMPTRTRSPCGPAWRCSALRDGRLDEDAERLLDEIGDLAGHGRDGRSGDRPGACRAASGARRRGGRAARRSTARSRRPRRWGFGGCPSNGLEPWTLIALATDLLAHVAVRRDAPPQQARTADLAAETA